MYVVELKFGLQHDTNARTYLLYFARALILSVGMETMTMAVTF
jgi:hypothetical protein